MKQLVILLLCGVAMGQVKPPTYTVEPLTHQVAHCDPGWHLERWYEPMSTTLANNVCYANCYSSPGYYPVLAPAMPANPHPDICVQDHSSSTRARWTIEVHPTMVIVCSVLPPYVEVGGGDNCDFHSSPDPVYCKFIANKGCGDHPEDLVPRCGTDFGCQNLEATRSDGRMAYVKTCSDSEKLANIYADPKKILPMANPIAPDAHGRYTFYTPNFCVKVEMLSTDTR